MPPARWRRNHHCSKCGRDRHCGRLKCFYREEHRPEEYRISETARLADQIRRAFDGDAWHGDSFLELLNGVNARTAAAHPIKDAHSIWELVLHIAAWDGAVLTRTQGTAVELKDRENFPPVTDASEAAWEKAIQHSKAMHNNLVKAVASFPESRLLEQ